MAKYKEYIDGLEVIHEIEKKIQTELDRALKAGMLDLELFDYFQDMINDTRDMLQQHIKSEYLLKKLSELEEWLRLKKEIFEKTGRL